jgi:hypothetical protein
LTRIQSGLRCLGAVIGDIASAMRAR